MTGSTSTRLWFYYIITKIHRPFQNPGSAPAIFTSSNFAKNLQPCRLYKIIFGFSIVISTICVSGTGKRNARLHNIFFRKVYPNFLLEIESEAFPPKRSRSSRTLRFLPTRIAREIFFCHTVELTLYSILIQRCIRFALYLNLLGILLPHVGIKFNDAVTRRRCFHICRKLPYL